jgi:copper chaperone CopZ
MVRRRFLQGITFASGAGLTAKQPAASSRHMNVTYKVTGFTCITCAVGLETLLKGQKGVIQVKATYPDGTVRIDYDPDLIADASLQDYIREIGFRVAEEH